jgi:uncharacterized protein (TIGR03435 family)
MARLAYLLSDLGLNLVDRRVVDRTGFTGTFDVELRWAPQRHAMGHDANAVSVDEVPSLFTAVQEQLGLKLVPRDEGIEVLVVEHIETPTPN